MALTRLELTARPFQEGRSFGEAGPYEELEGRAHFALDPGHTLNKVITDLGLAPPGEDGRVHFSADLVLLRPQQPARGNRRLLIDIPNRGRTTAVRMLDIEPAEPLPTGRPVAGDGWLLQRGYTIACCGWQHDVPLGRGLLGISVPEAVIDGKPVEGRLMFEFQPAAPAQSVMLSSNIAETVHRPYPAKDLEDPTAVLLVRDHAFGPAEVIGRDRWSFARSEAGRIVPDPTHVYFADGFEPGRRYEVVYTAVGAPLTGLGFAATRDLASFLRYGSVEDGNPCAGHLEHTLAFGASQSGRFLRQLLYLGLYRDEKGRMALDGLLPHIAGGRMTEANWRFGQPSYLGPSSVINLFPFSDAVQTDTATGRTDGLQSRANASGKAPKMMYVNSSAEYWGSQAGLVHSALDGGADVVPPDKRTGLPPDGHPACRRAFAPDRYSGCQWLQRGLFLEQHRLLAPGPGRAYQPGCMGQPGNGAPAQPLPQGARGHSRRSGVVKGAISENSGRAFAGAPVACGLPGLWDRAGRRSRDAAAA